MTLKFELRMTNSGAYSIDEYDKNGDFLKTPSAGNKLEISESEAESLSNKYGGFDSDLTLEKFYQKIIEYITMKNGDSITEDGLNISEEDLSIYDDIIEESIQNNSIKSLFSIGDEVRLKDPKIKKYGKVISLELDEDGEIEILVKFDIGEEIKYREDEIIKIDQKRLKTLGQFINLNSNGSGKENIISFISKLGKEQINNLGDIQLAFDEIENNEKIEIGDKIDIIGSIRDSMNIEIDKRKREMERLKEELDRLNDICNMGVSIAMRELKKSGEKRMDGSTHKFTKKETEYVNITNIDSIPDNLKKKIEYFEADKREIKKLINQGEEIKGAEIGKNEFYYVDKN